ncbi:unnamed protein product [Arctogadus glacialis]
MCGLHEVDPQGSTEPLSGSDAGDTGQEAGEASMYNLFPMDHEARPEPASLSGRFGTAQLEDPNLTSALQQVTVVDGKAINGVEQPMGMRMPYPGGMLWGAGPPLPPGRS